jgi:hypothetical protein
MPYSQSSTIARHISTTVAAGAIIQTAVLDLANVSECVIYADNSGGGSTRALNADCMADDGTTVVFRASASLTTGTRGAILWGNATSAAALPALTTCRAGRDLQEDAVHPGGGGCGGRHSPGRVSLTGSGLFEVHLLRDVDFGERRNPRRSRMKFIARAVLAAVLLVAASVQAAQGSIGVATTDNVAILINGTAYANAHWQVTTAGTATVTTEFTSDGVNWKAAPFTTRTDVVSANPATTAQQNTTPVVGGYDTPIPGNARAFRIRCGTTGTSTVVSVSTGSVYQSNTPVVAILFDTTSGVNSPIDTGILDAAGWVGFAATFVTPAGGSGAVKEVDDAGVNTASVTVPASATVTGVFSEASVTATALGTTGTTSVAWRSKRIQLTSAAVAALTSRVRIEAWR